MNLALERGGVELTTVKMFGLDTRFSRTVYQESPNALRRRVVDTVNQDVYGSLTNDTDTDLRIKCLAACLISSLVVGLRICFRVILLAQGNSFQRASERAKLLWDQERYACYLNAEEMPNQLDLEDRVFYEQEVQFAKDILKIVSYPLAWIALEFSALLGLCFPIYGRYFFTTIEQFFSVEFAPESDLFSKDDQMRICNYMAPCFLPLRVWQDENLFSFYSGWNSRFIKNLCLEAKNLHSKYSFYFSPQLGEKLEECRSFVQESQICNRTDQSVLSRRSRGAEPSHQRFSVYLFLHEALDSLPGLMREIIETQQALVEDSARGLSVEASRFRLSQLESRLSSTFLQTEFTDCP